MAIKLHQLREETASIDVVFDTHEITIEYRIAAFTAEIESRLHQADDEKKPANGLAEVLCQIVKAWDILDEDDTPLPVTLELMRQLPYALMQEMVKAIVEDLSPNVKSAGH